MLDVWEPLGPVPPWETVGRSPVVRGFPPMHPVKVLPKQSWCVLWPSQGPVLCLDQLPNLELISYARRLSILLAFSRNLLCLMDFFFVFHFPDVCSLVPSSVCFTFILPFSCQVLQDGCLDNWLRLFLFSNTCIQCSEFSFQHCFSCNPQLLMSCSFISFWFSAFFNFPGDFLFKSWFM